MPSPAYELTSCPVCGANDGREVAGADDVRAEMEALWEFHTRRLKPETPPQRLADRVAFSQRPPLRLVQCVRCGLVYRNPREREWELSDTYSGERVSPEVLCALFETQRASYRAQAARLSEQLGRAGSGIEVGSYVGAFLAAAREAGWRFEGVDVNEDATAFARGQRFTVTVGTIEEFASAHADRRVDAVAFWNCFDQLPDPRRAALAARSLLSPGGVLAVRVPNGGFYAALRPKLEGFMAPVARALLAHNNLLGFPYRHGFTTGSLTRLLEVAGLTVQRVYGDTLVPIADEWTKRWAALEERLTKRVLRAALGGEEAPWIEVYARAG